MSVNFGPGFHAAPGARVNRSAYDGYLGRWSRLFVREVLAAAEIAESHRILDVATGPGEAASVALAQIDTSGLVVGVDISLEMLHTARTQFADRAFRAVMADGQALPFADVLPESRRRLTRIPTRPPAAPPCGRVRHFGARAGPNVGSAR